MNDLVRSVALLLHDEAQRHGRTWDYPGVHVTVRAALEEDRRTPRQVVEAGFSAIEDKAAQTPGAIRWSIRYGASVTAGRTGPGCRTCGRSQQAHDLAEAKAPADVRHAFEVTP